VPSVVDLNGSICSNVGKLFVTPSIMTIAEVIHENSLSNDRTVTKFDEIYIKSVALRKISERNRSVVKKN